jgi:transcriptional regulator with XRE-family HTH domain
VRGVDIGLCLEQTGNVVQPNPINAAFGAAVAKRRDELGMTQAELSGHTGLSRASIASIEKGRQNVLLHHVYDLAQALRLRHVGDLLPARPHSRQRQVEDKAQRPEIEVRVTSGSMTDRETADVLELLGRHVRIDDVEIRS